MPIPTPRTDAQEKAARDVNGGIIEMVPADFARQLEREVTELRNQFKREVENAYREGHKDAGGFPTSLDFKYSHARRIVKGEAYP